MKIFLQIILGIVLLLCLTVGILWYKVTFAPPEPQIPEKVSAVSVKSTPGKENFYNFYITLPLGQKVDSCRFSAPESVIPQAVTTRFDAWHFDRVKWQISGSFRALDEGTLSDLAVEIDTDGKTFTAALPEITVILPESDGKLTTAPPPEASVNADGKPYWKYLTSGAVFVIISAMILVILLRRKKQAVPPGAYAKERIVKLNRQVQSGSITPAEGITGLSDTLRDYLDCRLNIPAKEMTSNEFIRMLAADTIIPDNHGKVFLTGFCQYTDMVKFAGKSVTVREMDNFSFEALALIQNIEKNLEDRKK